MTPVGLHEFFLAVPDSPEGADPDTPGSCTLYNYADENLCDNEHSEIDINTWRFRGEEYVVRL